MGALVVAVTTLIASAGSPLAIPFALWSLAPYAVLLGVGRAAANPWPVSGAGLAALAVDVGVRASVFVWPRASTAAVALVFSPAYILAIMPAGAALGWLSGILWRWHALGRVLVIVIVPVIAGLMTLGFARPDLFPTTVARRRALLARVGPPRIVVGAGAFTSTLVSDQPQWAFASELDGAPGDELALVDHRGARILDPDTLQARRTLTFADRRFGFWDSFATLVRLPSGEVAVAQTGGGYSRTLLRRLDDSTLWEYHPQPELPPSSLDPADLDGDGVIEFYAASANALARLDPDGRTIWEQPTKLADIAALLPRAQGLPGWVVGAEYGVRALICSDSGELLGTLPLPPGVITAAADFANQRLLFVGSTAVRGYALDGTLRAEISLGDFAATQIAGVRIASGAPGALVVVGAADHDAHRWRLLIVDGSQRVVYDEITDTYPRVFVARGATGRDAVFIATEGRLRRLSD